VENLSHTLVGVAMSRAGLDKKTALATPILAVAANLPDIDVFGSFIGNHYLDFHRGVTHAAIGLAGLSLLMAGVTYGITRTRKSWAESSRFLPILYVCFIGLLSHPLLDFLNDYGVRPWLPFNGRRYYGDLISIVDPWIWLIFWSGLALVATSRVRTIVWFWLALAMAGVVGWGVSWSRALLWITVLVLSLGAGRVLQQRGFHPPRMALLAFALYLTAIVMIRSRVVEAAHERGPALISERVERIDVLPAGPGQHRWRLILETPGKFYIAEVESGDWRDHPPEFQTYSKNLNDPCYLQSLSQKEMAAMARFARFPSVDVQKSGEVCVVYLRDLRYARQSVPGWGVARAVVEPSLPGRTGQ
jgi:inner membrane protein